MLLRILSESFIRRKRRKAVGILAIALGSSLATALIGISIEVGDKLSQELKVYGSNILVRPKSTLLSSELGPMAKQEYLDEKSLLKIKETFWTNNIVGFAPFLSTWAQVRGQRVAIKGTWFDRELMLSNGQRWRTGTESLFRFWKIEGEWPRDGGKRPEALVGAALAQALEIRVGESLLLTRDGRRKEVKVVGMVTSGEEFDSEIVLDLEAVQELADLPDRVSQVFVSALTTPENELQKLYHKNPQALSGEEYERWACTPYVSTICALLQDEIHHCVAEPILEVAEREGMLLSKLKALFIYICVAALLTAGFGLTSTLMATVAERRKEVGLLRALGAQPGSIVIVFLAELAVMALIGSLLGGALGYGLGQVISLKIFETPVSLNPVVIFVVAAVTLSISLVGGLFPIRSALRLDPVRVLHEI